MAGIAECRAVSHVSRVVFEPMRTNSRLGEDVRWQNISFDEKSGRGSHIMMMAPEVFSTPLQHVGTEKFYVPEGQFANFDAHVYAAGDFVSQRAESRLCSSSVPGCWPIVTPHDETRTQTQEEWGASS